MAWRNPQYAYVHAARDIGVSGISWSGAEATGFPEENLIDDRMTTLFKWSAAAASHYIQLDLGASFDTGLNRLYIPNHNIAGAWTLQEDTVATMDSPPTTIGSGTATAGTDIDVSVTASTKRYIRFTVTPSGQWELGQFWLSKLVTTTRGPEPTWTDELEPNVTQFPNGDSLQTDPDQRFLEYTYRWVGRSTAADLTSLEALVAAVSTYRPFILDTAYDSGDGGATYVVKLTAKARARNDSQVPQSHARSKSITLSMLEYLG